MPPSLINRVNILSPISRMAFLRMYCFVFRVGAGRGEWLRVWGVDTAARVRSGHDDPRPASELRTSQARGLPQSWQRHERLESAVHVDEDPQHRPWQVSFTPTRPTRSTLHWSNCLHFHCRPQHLPSTSHPGLRDQDEASCVVFTFHDVIAALHLPHLSPPSFVFFQAPTCVWNSARLALFLNR